MIVKKQSNYTTYSKYSDEQWYSRYLDGDVSQIITCLQGRVKLGENVGGVFVQYTSNGTPDTEDTVTHNIGSIPTGYIILWQSKAGSFYQGPTTGTAWSTTKLYLKCSVASVTAYLFIFK